MTMMDLVLDIPEQLSWGAEVSPPDLPSGRPIVLVGMGGSAMGAGVGSLAAGAAPQPIVVHRSYGLPAWAVAASALVVGVSYSGNTEEVLSAVAAALDAGLPVAGVASGGGLAGLGEANGFPVVAVPPGLQPRAALGYQASAVVAVLRGAGAVSGGSSQLEEAAETVTAFLGGGEGAGFALGVDLGEALVGRVTIAYGATGPGALAAYRWKTQINENAKMPAWWHEFPELNHNELQGWEALPDLTTRSLGVVFLRDTGDPAPVQRRMDLTREAIEGNVFVAGEVLAQGSGPLARFFTLAATGDVASIVMAQRAGIDPEPVATIERFKVRLAEG